MKKLIIDRTKWARRKQDMSQPYGVSKLLNETGGMCCLGFDVLNNGASTREVLGNYTPNKTNKLERFCSLNDADINCAVDFNDRISASICDKLTDQEQEDKIKKIFLRNKVEVEFIN